MPEVEKGFSQRIVFRLSCRTERTRSAIAYRLAQNELHRVRIWRFFDVADFWHSLNISRSSFGCRSRQIGLFVQKNYTCFARRMAALGDSSNNKVWRVKEESEK